MKIAVAYEDGNVFQHFGHTEQFKIYTAEDGKIVSAEVVPTNGSGHGALAGFLRERGVDVLILRRHRQRGKSGARRCGHRALRRCDGAARTLPSRRCSGARSPSTRMPPARITIMRTRTAKIVRRTAVTTATTAHGGDDCHGGCRS